MLFMRVLDPLACRDAYVRLLQDG